MRCEVRTCFNEASVVPPQCGRVPVATGANAGIGFVVALELACRCAERAAAAVVSIKQPQLAGSVEFGLLDMSSLASVRAIADTFKHRYDWLDLLLNNAGIMAVPNAVPADGVESSFTTNYLGHFVLTAQLWGMITKSPRKRRTSRPRRYANSKFVNLLFAFELNHRCKAPGHATVAATAAYPGFTSTNISQPMGDSFKWFAAPALHVRVATATVANQSVL